MIDQSLIKLKTGAFLNLSRPKR